MKGLILKDWLCLLDAYCKNLTLVFAVYTLVALYAGTAFLPLMMPYLLGFYSLSAIGFDDYAHWNRYALTLPVSRKQIVLSKYLLTLAGIAIGILYCTLMGVLMPLAAEILGHEAETDFATMFFGGLGVGLFSLLANAVLLPMAFKSSMEKARSLMMGGMVLFFVVCIGAGKLLSGGSLSLGETLSAVSPGAALAVLGILCLIACYVSYRICLRVFQNKEV